MTTILSENQQQSIEILFSGSYKLMNGSRIVICDRDQMTQAIAFLESNGFGGIYFNPCGEVEIHSEWSVSMLDSDQWGVLEFYGTK